MKNEWDDYAQDWDTDSSVKQYAQNAFSQLNTIINIDGLTVLDFGCGTGSLTQLLSPKADHVVALDGSAEMIKQLDKKALRNVTSLAAFLTPDNLDAVHGPFDVIVASSVCSFLPDYPQTLALLKTLLKPNGCFVQWDWLAKDESASTGLSLAQVQSAFKHAGFQGVELSTPFEMSSSKGTQQVLMAAATNSVL